MTNPGRPFRWVLPGGVVPGSGTLPGSDVYPDGDPFGTPSPTTPLGWEIDGQSLNTHAFNISTRGGNLHAPPKLRGDNVAVPFRSGTVWTPKLFDEREITLDMWLIGATRAGRIMDTDTFDANFAYLRELMVRRNRPVKLSKWVRNRDGVIVRLSAAAEYVDGLEREHEGGPNRAKIAPRFRLADPYFYAETTRSLTFTPGSLDGQTQTLTSYGDDATDLVRVTVQTDAGGSRGVTLTVSSDDGQPLLGGTPWPTTTARRVSQFYNNRRYLFDSGQRSATLTVLDAADPTLVYQDANWRHSGAPQWLLIPPGNVSITCVWQQDPNLTTRAPVVVEFTERFW